MDDVHQRVLHEAAIIGNVRQLETAIAQGVDVNAVRRGSTALCSACLNGHHKCAQRLLAAGADTFRRALVAGTQVSVTPLHLAASHDSHGHTVCVAALLQAGADPWASFGADSSVALHMAAGLASVDAVRLLCEVAHFRGRTCLGGEPAARQQVACLTANRQGITPLHVALQQHRMPAAHYMVAAAPWGPEHIHAVLAVLVTAGAKALPLYPALVARYPLTASQWAQVPHACPGLGAVLPAVVRRSEAEVVLLVRRMTDTERQHLRAQALCLGVAQRRGSLPSLPTPIVQRLLADCAAHFAAAPPEQQKAWHRVAWTRRRKLSLLAGTLVATTAAGALVLCASERPA